jgi:predicted transcriptional regulator
VRARLDNPNSEAVTTQELEIMKMIWPLGRVTVLDVDNALRERRAHSSGR